MVSMRAADRARVIALRQDGHTAAEIMRRTGYKKDFVYRWVSAADNGEDVTDRPRSGRPPKVTPPVIRQVRAHMKGKRRRSTRKVAQIMAERHGTVMSRESVRRAAKKAGLTAYHRQKKPLLTERIMRRRFRFARALPAHGMAPRSLH